MPYEVSRITTDLGELDLVRFDYGPFEYPSGSVTNTDYSGLYKPGSDYSQPPLAMLPLDVTIKAATIRARQILEKRNGYPV